MVGVVKQSACLAYNAGGQCALVKDNNLTAGCLRLLPIRPTASNCVTSTATCDYNLSVDWNTPVGTENCTYDPRDETWLCLDLRCPI